MQKIASRLYQNPPLRETYHNLRMTWDQRIEIEEVYTAEIRVIGMFVHLYRAFNK